MKKLLFLSFLPLLFLLWCSKTSKAESWQWAYYYWWTDDTNIVQWPVFTNYEWCKEWALQMKKKAYNWYTYCSKNCHTSVDSTPICEEVVRSWHPMPWFWITFDEK